MSLLPKFDDTALHRRGMLLRRITELESELRETNTALAEARDREQRATHSAREAWALMRTLSAGPRRFPDQ